MLVTVAISVSLQSQKWQLLRGFSVERLSPYVPVQVWLIVRVRILGSFFIRTWV